MHASCLYTHEPSPLAWNWKLATAARSEAVFSLRKRIAVLYESPIAVQGQQRKGQHSGIHKESQSQLRIQRLSLALTAFLLGGCLLLSFAGCLVAREVSIKILYRWLGDRLLLLLLSVLIDRLTLVGSGATGRFLGR